MGDSEGVERLLKMQLEQAKQTQDRAKIVVRPRPLGELYQKLLNEPELAIDAYEAAQAFDPEGKERGELLAELYASDVTQYLDKAVRAQAQMLRQNPYRVESYKLLRRLYTEARRPDPAWCLCQALVVLNLAEPDEERFYRRHRPTTPRPRRRSSTRTTGRCGWRTRTPIRSSRGSSRSSSRPSSARAPSRSRALGYDARFRLESGRAALPRLCRRSTTRKGVLGFEAPPVFQNPNDPAGLGFLHAHTPSIVLGVAAFESSVPSQSLAFVAGRHLTYFRPGYYVRHLVPDGDRAQGVALRGHQAVRPAVPRRPRPSGPGRTRRLPLMTKDFQGASARSWRAWSRSSSSRGAPST